MLRTSTGIESAHSSHPPQAGAPIISSATAVTAAWGNRYHLTGDNVQVTLPASTGNAGRFLEVFCTHSNGGDLVRPGSENINGAGANQACAQFGRYFVYTDGTNYFVSVALAPA